MVEERVMRISHLRDSLGWACQEVARSEIPIVVQRYSRKDVALVPLWEWEFFKDMEAAIRAGRRPWDEPAEETHDGDCDDDR